MMMMAFGLLSLFAVCALCQCDQVALSSYGTPSPNGVAFDNVGALFWVTRPAVVTGAVFAMNQVSPTVSVTLFDSSGSLLALATGSYSQATRLTTISFSKGIAVSPSVNYTVAVQAAPTSQWGVSYYARSLPVASIQTTYIITRNRWCNTGANCFPATDNRAGTLVSLAPVVCSCGSYASTCSTCAATNQIIACGWCLDTQTCVAGVNSTCRSLISNPVYCPKL